MTISLAREKQSTTKGTIKGRSPTTLQAIRLKPDYALAYYNRGLAKYDLGDNQEAIKDYDKAIQINQNWGELGLWAAYNNRGVAKYDLGDKPEAIKRLH